MSNANTNASPFRFQCQSGQTALAARIASLKTTAIQEMFKECFGSTVNIMQKFTNPPKCKAAEYIVDNAPQSVLQQCVAQNLARWEREVEESNGRGRPVNKYRHDGEHNNNSIQQAAKNIQVDDDVSAIVSGEIGESETEKRGRESDEAKARTEKKVDADGEEEEDIEQLTAVMRDILAKGKKGAMDEGRVREIAREEDNNERKAMEATVAQHIAKLLRPTVVHVQYQEKDGGTALRDMGMQHKQFPKLMALCQQRSEHNGNRPNIWLPGPAGSGKTTAAENLAAALGLKYSYMGALMDKTEAFGYMDAHGKYVETEFYRAWKDGGVFLWDEADGSDPMQGVCMNAPLAGQWCAFPCGMVKRHPDFVFIAAANTYGQGANAKYVGRNRLDAATLNRFIKLPWETDLALEEYIIANKEWSDLTAKYRSAVERLGYDIVISTRNGQNAVMMAKCEDGKMFSKLEIIELAFRDGMTDDQWQQVTRAVR